MCSEAIVWQGSGDRARKSEGAGAAIWQLFGKQGAAAGEKGNGALNWSIGAAMLLFNETHQRQ